MTMTNSLSRNCVSRRKVGRAVRLASGLLLAAWTLSATRLHAESPTWTPAMIIEKSIAHHDPNNVWATGRVQLGIDTKYSDEYAVRAGTSEVKLTLLLAPRFQEFRYVKETGDDRVEIGVHQGEASLLINGSADVAEEDVERLRIREPEMYRDYCEYLYGMPMKLRDPGTMVDPLIESSPFGGQEALRLKVTYDPDVGSHTWYFYFHPATCALIGYRFYFDESKNDGEYITFEGEIVDEASGLRLPKARAWYFNADGKHLATDDIVSITVSR